MCSIRSGKIWWKMSRRKGWRKPTPLKFCEWAETWFQEGERKRQWKPRTVKAYRTVLDRLKRHFGPMPLAAIRPRDVAEYVRKQDSYGPATVNRDLSVLHDVFSTAQREELIESNPASRAERPKLSRPRYRILEPAEISRIARALVDKPKLGVEDQQARLAFLTLVITGVRRSELQALKWQDLDFVECVLRVRNSKSEKGIRSIALGPELMEEFWQHRRRSTYQGDDERAFCNPRTGGCYWAEGFGMLLREAMKSAGVDGPLRPFHDLRHASLTNGAAAGEAPIGLMTRAGHRSMKTTQIYLYLAGVVFREDAERLERRLLAGLSTNGEALSTQVSTDLR